MSQLPSASIWRAQILTALGVRHGFSTRQGGVSQGRYATLNLGQKWGDDPDAQRENLRRFADAGGFSAAALVRVRQVHGNRVVRADTVDATTEADGIVTARAGIPVGVLTADCVPLLFADGRGRVAAVHAGWRGTVADIAGVAVRELVALGARVDELRVALGPSICVDCFEVGSEVADAFLPVAPSSVQARAGARPHVDLWRANRVLLERAGVRAGYIDDRPPCTMHEPERFFSFRRDGANIGQQLSFVTS